MSFANINQKQDFIRFFQFLKNFKTKHILRNEITYFIGIQILRKYCLYPNKESINRLITKNIFFPQFYNKIIKEPSKTFYNCIMSQNNCQYKIRKRQLIDIIHGRIEFDQTIWTFIDTPHFQRLRKIKQLGGLSYVYPSATHTRFEHCIGTAYLAKRFIQSLVKNCYHLYSHLKESEIQSIIRTITIAGLLHDIGHGPFSHSFDSSVVKQIHKEGIGMIKWSHELASEVLFEHMINLPQLKDKLSENEIKRIKLMINGTPQGQRLWQFDLISNKHNGIDVDKFDYFRRDTFYLKDTENRINHELFIEHARIINSKICFPLSLAGQIKKFYQSRYKLYQKYYYDYTNKQVEMMICDIMILAKDLFCYDKVCQTIDKDPYEYMRLTDHIIQEIQSYYYKVCLKKQDKDQIRDKSTTQLYSKLKKAVEVLNRIRNRDLYKLVKDIRYIEYQQSSKQLRQFIIEEVSFNKITSSLAQKTGISKELFHVLISDLNCGLKARRPLQKVDFFNNQLLQYQIIGQQNILKSTQIFEINAEKTIKVFIKVFTAQNYQKTENALTTWIQEFNTKLKQKLLKQSAQKHFLFEANQQEKYFKESINRSTPLHNTAQIQT